jgi:thioredoxin reductase/ferredoxin
MLYDALSLILYIAPLALIWVWYARKRRRDHQASLSALQESVEAGLTEPVSLHPVIDPNRCIGCGSCVAVCPEMPAHQVLGLVHRKAALVSPTDCIGHGACQAACPVDAITLVFGTERRGVELPFVKPNFESNVPGIFIAGELGGMGLIRNAIEQGRQAMEAIGKSLKKSTTDGAAVDVLIVGAGPSGIAASLAAQEKGLRYITIEQERLGGTVANFPRGKLVMTAPATLPIVGRFRFKETSKERLLSFWHQIEQEHKLNIHYKEILQALDRKGPLFIIKTSRGEYRAQAVLLAIGRRGTPRKLEVPGEQLPKVVYRLIDPAQYQGKKVLVVGGGDSAIEAAVSLAEQPDTEVALSYRSETFQRAKRKNRDRLEAAQKSGRVTVLTSSNVKRITKEAVELEQRGKTLELPNDIVIVNVGGVLPTPFLKEIGIETQVKYGTA